MSMIQQYDAALFDLDGVVYLGPHAVENAPESIAWLREQGIRIGFVTNNAARAPQTVADHLTELGVTATVEDVVTSAQAIARLMASELPEGAPVLVTGTRALKAEISAVGLSVVNSHLDHPVAVVAGYDPEMTFPRLDDACHAIQNGARWFMSNTDSTRPTDKGLVPGAGGVMALIASAVDAEPTIAGKPYAPLMEETVLRLKAERPLFIGDRLDTDVMGAVGVGMDSLFVFTGAHGKKDLLGAGPEARPTHLGWDLTSLKEPARQLEVGERQARCGDVTASINGGEVVIDRVPEDVNGQLDALWAVLHLVWEHGVDGQHAASRLTLLS